MVQKFWLCLHNQLDEPVFPLIKESFYLVSDNKHN